MAYTAVPSVVTGQTYSAANYNMYVKDNFAALWLYSAAGDIVYASSATTLARLAKGAAGTTLRMNSGATAPEWVKEFNQFGTKKSPSGWGVAKAEGTYTLNVTDFDAAHPSGIKAIILAISAKWTSASDGDYVNVRPTTAGSGNGIMARAQVANFFNDAMGVIPVNSSGNIDVIIVGTNPTVTLDMWGYWR